VDERDRTKGKSPHDGKDPRHSPRGTGAAVDYDDSRGDMRYVGGGREGGQNYANEGYGANQSYSAGPGYQQGDDAVAADDNGTERDFAVKPSDLGVKDYDLQGSYGRPAEDAKAKPKPSARDGDDDRR
jgi:hypothetical protein